MLSIDGLLSELGKELKRTRIRSGYTQEFLADRTGLHRNTINAIEHGMCDLKISSLFRLIMMLGIIDLETDFTTGTVCYSGTGPAPRRHDQ